MKSYLAILFFVGFTVVNGWLLFLSKTTVAESISFFALCSVISLVIFFVSEIQEFSIAGNIVKLREVRKDADKAIAELQASRLAMFSFLLDMARKFDGGFASTSPKDERLDDFLFLYENIKNSGLEEKLSEKIASSANLFIKAQLRCCNVYSQIDITRSYTPDELTSEALKNENIDARLRSGTIEQNRMLALEAISCYRKVYDIYKKSSGLL